MSGLFRRVWPALAAALAVVPHAGCRDRYDLARVTGRVTTCEGKPAAGGVVEFYPVDAPDQTGRPAGNPGRPSRGTIAEDGTFTLSTVGSEGRPDDGAVIGPHRVVFQMPPTRRRTPTGDDRALMTPEEFKAFEAKLAGMKVYPPLPCGDKITPGEVVVKPGANEFEFTLPPK